MDKKIKRTPNKWKRRIKLILLVITICLTVILIGLNYALTPRKNCFDSRNLDIRHPMSDIREPITSDNIKKLTYLMDYSPIALITTDGGSVKYNAFLSEDNQILMLTGISFIFPTQTFHTGRTTATWELNKDKEENPFCYLYVGKMGSTNREAIAISSDNRYVLLEQSYHQANCLNYACIFVYDREHNLEIPYLEFDQNLFEFELTEYGLYSPPNTPYCLSDFEHKELFQYLSNRLDADQECINSIILSSDNNFAVVLLSIKADGYFQGGRIEIWGIIN